MANSLQLIAYLGAGMLTLALLRRVLFTVRQWRYQRGSAARQPVDISAQQIPLPEAAYAVRDALLALGFERLGECQVSGPDLEEPSKPTWNFVNAEQDTFVEVVVLSPLAPLCFFSTLFADDAVVQVAYPIGEHIEDPHFVHHKNTESIAAAYAEHRALIQEARAEHGSPRAIRSMYDALECAKIYRALYQPRLYQAMNRRMIIPPLLLNVIAVLLMLGAVATVGRYEGDLIPLALIGAAGDSFILSIYLSRPG